MQNEECKMQNERRLIDGNKAQAVLVNMAEHLLEAGNPEMAGAVGYAAEVIGKQPAVDAVVVVHGRWIEKTDMVSSYLSGCEELFAECSVCHAAEISGSNYCPNCGAKMDGGNEDGK